MVDPIPFVLCLGLVLLLVWAVATLERQVTTTGVPIKCVRVENNSPGLAFGGETSDLVSYTGLHQFGRILVL